jgi:hypothetical protein
MKREPVAQTRVLKVTQEQIVHDTPPQSWCCPHTVTSLRSGPATMFRRSSIVPRLKTRLNTGLVPQSATAPGAAAGTPKDLSLGPQHDCYPSSPHGNNAPPSMLTVFRFWRIQVTSLWSCSQKISHSCWRSVAWTTSHQQARGHTDILHRDRNSILWKRKRSHVAKAILSKTGNSGGVVKYLLFKLDSRATAINGACPGTKPDVKTNGTAQKTQKQTHTSTAIFDFQQRSPNVSH